MIPVSLLSSYLYCPRKIFLEKVLEIRAPPGIPAFEGSVKHRVYDVINKTEEELVTSIKTFIPFNDIFSLYRKSYSKILLDRITEFKPQLKELNIDPMKLFHRAWEIFLEEAKIRSSNVFDFIKVNKVYSNKLWEQLAPKYLTEYSIKSEKLDLIGMIDRIEINNNNYTPFELKSGSAPDTGVWPGNKIQLMAYILMLKEKFGNSSEGYIYYTDCNEKRKVVINPFSEQEVARVKNNVLDLLKLKEPPKICENKNKCASCQLKEKCYKLKNS